MLRYAYLASAALLLSNTFAFAQQGRLVEGYLKRDVKVFDGTETLRSGQKISCNLTSDGKECCYEDHQGTACVNPQDINISDKKVAKRDVAIAAILVNQSAKAQKNACEEGVVLKDKSDAFAWSYGVRLRPDVKGRALIRVSHVARKGPLMYPLPNLTKTWIGPIDEKCHPFNFTKDDITAFLQEYAKIGEFLDPAIDLNLKVEVWVELFSEFAEESYQNNLVKIPAFIPADTAESWPSPSRKY